MPRADRIFSQDQQPIAWIPDGKSPVSNEPCKAFSSPLFVGRSNDRNIRRTDVQNIMQLADEVCAVVQAAIPGDGSAGWSYMWLRFAARFLRCMERLVQNAYVALEIRAAIIWAIRSENRL